MKSRRRRKPTAIASTLYKCGAWKKAEAEAEAEEEEEKETEKKKIQIHRLK